MAIEPEHQPQSMPVHSERMPMPAPGNGARPMAEAAKANMLGLGAVVILAAGLAASIAFKGEIKEARPAVPAPSQAEVGVVNSPSPSYHSTPAVPVVVSALPEGGIAQSQRPGSSPRPFFGGDAADNAPRAVPVLEPLVTLQTRTSNAQAAGSRAVVQPARLQPVRSLFAYRSSTPAPLRKADNISARAAAFPAAQSGGGGLVGFAGKDLVRPCPACSSNSLAPRQGMDASIPAQKGAAQGVVGRTFVGMCEGKYVYKYTNVSDESLRLRVTTTGGETWTFKLPPRGTKSINSSTEFTSGSFYTEKL